MTPKIIIHLGISIVSAIGSVTMASTVDTDTNETPITPPAKQDSAIRLDAMMHLRLAHGSTSLSADEVAFGGHDPSVDNFNF